MEHTEVEVLRGGEMRHTGEERPPERPIIGLFREASVDGRVVNGGLAMSVLRHG
jgi:hypothetical protein